MTGPMTVEAGGTPLVPGAPFDIGLSMANYMSFTTTAPEKREEKSAPPLFDLERALFLNPRLLLKRI